MRRTLERIIRHYGCQVTLVSGTNQKTVRAFFRPVPSKSLQNLRRSFEELGENPGGEYLFIGPADCGLDGAEELRLRGARYLPRRVETLMFGNEPCYVWGFLTRGGVEDGGAY